MEFRSLLLEVKAAVAELVVFVGDLTSKPGHVQNSSNFFSYIAIALKYMRSLAVTIKNSLNLKMTETVLMSKAPPMSS